MSDTVVLRIAMPGDAALLAATIAAAFEQYRGRLVPESAAFRETPEAITRELAAGSGAIIAERAGEALGCVMIRTAGADLYFGRLAVAPGARGRGIARRLLGAVEAEAVRRGLTGVRLGVRIALTGNQRLFTSAGYVETSREAHPGFDRPTSITMRKPLRPAARRDHMGAMHTAQAWRRDLHAHPEVGFTEFRTASRVAGALADLGWDVVTGPDAMVPAERLGVPAEAALAAAYDRAEATGADPRFLPAMRGGHTAVVATLRGGDGPHVGIRADMDALPILEEEAPGHRPARDGYASTHPGEMHACGHDGHVGMAVELAERLAANPPPGTVTIFFQPAEEGGRGGRAMAPTGLADGVDLLVAVHLGLSLPTGTLAASIDGLLANSKLRAVFRGRSAHPSLAPQDGRNALLGAASATLALQGMTRVAGHETRVSVGRIHGGTSSNIVPDTAELLCETRADDGDVNADLEARARAMLAGAAQMHGLTVDVELVGSVTTARADAPAVEAVAAAGRAAGLRIVEPAADSGVASDDATALMRRVQAHGGTATYVGLGSDLAGPHHTAGFDIDEAALAPGVDLLERLVRR